MSLSVVPVPRADYQACWVGPGCFTAAWPTRLGVPYPAAITLELEPEPRAGQAAPIDGTGRAGSGRKRWPQDAIRMASTLGVEPRVVRGGLPLCEAGVLGLRGVVWRRLTLAFTNRAGPFPATPAVASLRTRLLRELTPTAWPAPSGCHALLSVERECLFFASRRAQEVAEWLTRQVATAFRRSISYEEAQRVAHWVMREAGALGVHLERIAREQGRLRVLGCWDRRPGTPPHAGAAGGPALDMVVD